MSRLSNRSTVGVLVVFMIPYFSYGADQPKPNPAEEQQKFVISPKVAVVGKDYGVVVRPSKNCDELPPDILKGVKLEIRTTGFNLKPDPASRCFVTAKLTIENDAPLGEQTLFLVKDGSQAPVGTVTLSVVSVAPGPIPPGLEQK